MLETKVDQETSVEHSLVALREKKTHGHNKNGGKWRRNQFKTNLDSQGGVYSQVPPLFFLVQGYLKGNPVPVISGVMTPISRVK